MSSTRPLISGGQGWGHVFMPVDSTLNNWLIEITVCLLNGFVWTWTLFRANFEFKGKHSQGSISICQKQLLWVLQGSVVTLFRWSWKILPYFVANLSKTLHVNFYQNWSSIVEVMIKKFWCFLCPTVYIPHTRAYQKITNPGSECLSAVLLARVQLITGNF